MRRRWLAAAVAAALLCTAGASDPGERLRDPAREARAEHLFTQLRCLVCQNESIDDSEAPLAGDLRKIIRGEVQAGKSSDEIKRFLTDRYGEFVLLKPSFALGNAVLWVTPFAIVGLGAVGFLLASRRKREDEPAPLDEDEQRRVDLLAGDAK